jgi:hypothetical protein
VDSLNDRHRAVGRHYDEVAYDYEVTRLEQHSAVERAILESFTGTRQNIFCELSPDAQQAWLDLVEATAATAEGIGLSEHFLFVGRPRSD